jgi:hypothetical protein
MRCSFLLTELSDVKKDEMFLASNPVSDINQDERFLASNRAVRRKARCYNETSTELPAR